MTRPNNSQPLSPREVNDLHLRSDRDGGREALHHSLGILPYQASPGDHSHDGRDSRVLRDVVVDIAEFTFTGQVIPATTFTSIVLTNALANTAGTLDGSKTIWTPNDPVLSQYVVTAAVRVDLAAPTNVGIGFDLTSVSDNEYFTWHAVNASRNTFTVARQLTTNNPAQFRLLMYSDAAITLGGGKLSIVKLGPV